MAIITSKSSVALVLTAFALTACATGPKQIELPQSSLTASKTAVDGSAIAFQASDGQCNKSAFKISPRLSDGKYGPSERIEISSSTFKLKSKSLTQTKFASSRKQLYVKTMAPGSYVVTRIWCYRSDGRKEYSYFTKPERIDIFAEFEVEAGKTNYIGSVEVSKMHTAAAPIFKVSDKSAEARVFFDEHYADKTPPMQIKLAKRTGPMANIGNSSNVEELRRLLQLLKEKKQQEIK